jgi:hypothetical protein
VEEDAFAEFLRKPPKTGKENAVNVFKTSRDRLEFTLRSEDIEEGIQVEWRFHANLSRETFGSAESKWGRY